jgi:hypothetical protein
MGLHHKSSMVLAFDKIIFDRSKIKMEKTEKTNPYRLLSGDIVRHENGKQKSYGAGDTIHLTDTSARALANRLQPVGGFDDPELDMEDWSLSKLKIAPAIDKVNETMDLETLHLMLQEEEGRNNRRPKVIAAIESRVEELGGEVDEAADPAMEKID